MTEDTDSLSADEKAYFESRGEAEVKDAPQPEANEAEQAAPEVIDPETTDIDAIEEVKDEGDEKPKVHKVVPLPALTKERQKTKELTSKLSEAERRAAILEDRWNQVLAGQEQPQVKAEEKPQRPVDDPFAMLNYVADKLESQEKTAAEQQKAQEAERQHLAQVRELQTMEDQFRADNADYDDAVTFVAKSRDAELATIYPHSTPEQRAQVIRSEWLQIVQGAKQTRHNPAELVYNLAKSRGYAKAAPPAPKDQKAELEKLEAAIDGSTSLSDASGAAPATLSAQSIADMSPEQFAAWYAKPDNAAKFKRLAGG